MAKIRIIDEWLRSPVSPPSRHRSILVVAETWSEQRVLMRAFASCGDQTRPTIVLHGEELAIGPAGVDPHGHWGIHVEPPVDGRAQELREQLEFAAKRAGAAGKASRLEDETPDFDRQRTGFWTPGAPRQASLQRGARYEPAIVAPPEPSRVIPSAASQSDLPSASGGPADPATTVIQKPRAPASLRHPTPVPRRESRGWQSPVPSRTAYGFDLAPRLAARAATQEPLAKVVGQTMPLGFRLSETERAVLNALDRPSGLSLQEIAELAHTHSARSWIDEFRSRLVQHGIEIIAEVREPSTGEIRFALIRR